MLAQGLGQTTPHHLVASLLQTGNIK